MKQRKRTTWLLAVAATCAAVFSPADAASCMNPSQVPSLQVDKHQVCWSAVRGASAYDAVLGLSLAELGSTAPTLLEANVSCLGARRASTCVAVPFDPPVGDGYFFVVRANRGNAKGTYETGCPTELPERDAALFAVATCP
jgi:hypothetical protein